MPIEIDLQQVAQIAGYIGSIIALVGAVYGVVRRSLNKYVFAKIKEVDSRATDNDAKIQSLEKWNERQQQDIDVSFEKDKVIIKALRAALKAIHDGQANGEITGAIKAIDDFLQEQASIGASHRS